MMLTSSFLVILLATVMILTRSSATPPRVLSRYLSIIRQRIWLNGLITSTNCVTMYLLIEFEIATNNLQQQVATIYQ
jgi:hypothetical protein